MFEARRWQVGVLLFILLGFLCCLAALGQSYSIDWHKVAGGGGTSTNGQYIVAGTIGQPDAGLASGGSYVVTGGYWSMINVVQTAGSPWLGMCMAPGNQAIISWPYPCPGFVLQESLSLSPSAWGNSTASPSLVSNYWQVTVPVSPGCKFYRLLKE
jgi:hypothetical protein